MKIVGLMSGTSGDGVDAALIEVSGRGQALKARAIAAQSQRLSDLAHPSRDAAAYVAQLEAEPDAEPA